MKFFDENIVNYICILLLLLLLFVCLHRTLHCTLKQKEMRRVFLNVIQGIIYFDAFKTIMRILNNYQHYPGLLPLAISLASQYCQLSIDD